jgi:hypothetical protein
MQSQELKSNMKSLQEAVSAKAQLSCEFEVFPKSQRPAIIGTKKLQPTTPKALFLPIPVVH